MNESNLTNDAKLLLNTAYKAYLENIESGMIKSKARYLGSVPDIQEKLVPEINRQDISDLISELKISGYVNAKKYQGPFLSHASLTTKAIAYGEQRFKNDINAVIDGIIKIKKIIL